MIFIGTIVWFGCHKISKKIDKVYAEVVIGDNLHTSEMTTRSSSEANIVISEKLEEINQGEFEGKPRAECFTPQVLKLLETVAVFLFDFQA